MVPENKEIDAELEAIRKLLRQQEKEANRAGPEKKKSLKKTRAKRRLVRIRAELRERWRRVRNLRRKRREAQTPERKVREWFEDHEGHSEQPAGSNCGPHHITDSQHFLGYSWACRGGGSGVFWCGCTAGFALIKHGGAKIPNKIRIGYNGYIESDAAGRTNGLRKVDRGNASPLCLATMHYPHIVTILTAPDSRGNVRTGEGNTSSSANGSQNNGGEYAIKTHHVSEFDTVAEVAGIHFDKG